MLQPDLRLPRHRSSATNEKDREKERCPWPSQLRPLWKMRFDYAFLYVYSEFIINSQNHMQCDFPCKHKLFLDLALHSKCWLPIHGPRKAPIFDTFSGIFSSLVQPSIAPRDRGVHICKKNSRSICSKHLWKHLRKVFKSGQRRSKESILEK